MQQEKKEKRNKKNIEKLKKEHCLYSKLFLILIIIFGIFFFMLIFFEFGNFCFLKSFFSEPVFFEVYGDCSYAPGIGLVYQIESIEDCSVVCRNECEVRKMERFNYSFLNIQNPCNKCECYCK